MNSLTCSWRRQHLRNRWAICSGLASSMGQTGSPSMGQTGLGLRPAAARPGCRADGQQAVERGALAVGQASFASQVGQEVIPDLGSRPYPCRRRYRSQKSASEMGQKGCPDEVSALHYVPYHTNNFSIWKSSSIDRPLLTHRYILRVCKMLLFFSTSIQVDYVVFGFLMLTH